MTYEELKKLDLQDKEEKFRLDVETHLKEKGNVHELTPSQIGATKPLWNANRILGNPIRFKDLEGEPVLTYNNKEEVFEVKKKKEEELKGSNGVIVRGKEITLDLAKNDSVIALAKVLANKGEKAHEHAQYALKGDLSLKINRLEETKADKRHTHFEYLTKKEAEKALAKKTDLLSLSGKYDKLLTLPNQSLEKIGERFNEVDTDIAIVEKRVNDLKKHEHKEYALISDLKTHSHKEYALVDELDSFKKSILNLKIPKANNKELTKAIKDLTAYKAERNHAHAIQEVVGLTDRINQITTTSLGAQPQLNGTGFVRATGTTISYDSSTYINVLGSSQGIADYTIANDTPTSMFGVEGGADETLGPLYMGVKVNPSATGTNRFVQLQVGDNIAYRTLSLNPSGGNVGIGLTNPSEKLQVNGNIIATNLSGTNTGDNATNSQYSGLASSKQDALNGTGFVKATGTTISYDNSTYLTSVTAHNLLSTTHGDTLADTVVRGDIIYGNATPKWARLAFPASPTGKVLQATATDVAWSTNPLTIGASASVSGTNTGDQTSVSGNAGSASTVAIVDDTSTNATMYPAWVTTTTGNLPLKVSSSKLTFNPSTGALGTTTLNAVNATLARVSDAVILTLKGHSTQTNPQLVIQSSTSSELARLFVNSNLSIALGYTAGNAMGTATNSVYLGAYAGAQATGGSNTLLGHTAGYSIVAGVETVAVGFEAGRNSTGSYSTYVGTRAGYSNTANNNTYIGSYSGYSGTASVDNIAIGTSAMRLATASYTTAIGANAGYNATGNNGIYIGGYAGNSTTSGVENIAIGVNALRLNQTGGYSTAIGANAGYKNTVNNQTFIGSYAGYENTTGAENLAIGVNALRYNQTGGYNVAVGNYAGFNNTASYNTFLGGLAGYANTSGGYNVGIGFQTLRYNSTSSENVAIGDSVLFNTTAGYNVGIGRLALYTNGTGTYNIGIGNYANWQNSSGAKNVAIGNQSLNSNLGSNSVAVGYQAGYSNTNGGGVYIGYQAGYSETTANKLYIANSSTTTPLIYGDFATPNVTINGNLTIQDAKNIIFATTTGTKIGTGTTQKIGFWNATPVVQSTGWGATNVSSDKAFDANATSIDELADTLGTLIDTLKTYGLLGA